MASPCNSWFYNEGFKHLFLFFWLAVNTLIFWRTFSRYYSGPQYHYLRQMLGLGLCISRASASVLNFNCSLVLLPMCRTLLAVVRRSRRIVSRKTRRLLHKYKSFHAACGIAICVSTAVHVGAHIINAANFSTNYNSEYIALNVARYKNEDPRKIIFTSVPGVTGVLMGLILFLMSTASTASIRASNFDIFLHTHNLFFIFYVLLLVHASGGVLKYQTNLDEHPPGCLQLNRTMKYYAPLTELNGETYLLNTEKLAPSPFNIHGELLINDSTLRICTKDPAFHFHFPETWLWISAPLCLYCAERLYRYLRSTKPVTITSVIHHPCNVIEIRMIKDHFKARPGQYIILQCPRVSALENHPFTLTMCPTDTKATFAVHIKVVGDWTERLCSLLTQCDQGTEIIPIFQHRKNPKIYIDGPFGSPSEEVLNYEVSLCIAGGIGVTPYASIFNQLLDTWKENKLQRLYFVWICRDIQAFLWFADLLCILHKKFWQENRPDYLNIQLYLSQTDGIQEIIGEKYQALNARLIIGRPGWKLLFDEIAKSNRQKSVGVFCCGPKGLSKDLHKLCNRPNAYGTRFEYNKESFS
ncbi:NADPH oxidase 4-like [Bufo gargarizans]|uniref:NADPH oxidase 4-like n=1 Tax=Bufo gargarizans TaxID=30331 RepID=UPI001CF2D57D|nr:NADPH oxidase 4-like [Bufo gargarizans]